QNSFLAGGKIILFNKDLMLLQIISKDHIRSSNPCVEPNPVVGIKKETSRKPNCSQIVEKFLFLDIMARITDYMRGQIIYSDTPRCGNPIVTDARLFDMMV